MPTLTESQTYEETDSTYSDFDLIYAEKLKFSNKNMLGGSRSKYPNGFSMDQHSSSSDGQIYTLDHLATLSVGSHIGLLTPKDGLRRLNHLEKTNGIWTQKMKLKIDKNYVIIMDYETGDIVERFPMTLISEPTAYTSDDPMELYNNILIFIVKDDPKSKNSSEMHIFQCVKVFAQLIVDEMKMFMNDKGKISYSDRHHLPPPPSNPPPDPPVNGRVPSREHDSIFNSGYHPRHDSPTLQNRLERPDRNTGYARESNDETSSTNSDRYERDVAILNHCFDDIEKFIARLRQAAAAFKELELRQKNRKTKKKDIGDGMLSMRAKAPPEREFVDILQKFKLSFNLLAKLKSHIHDPNAPELVHFLFTPLALIVDAARDSYGPNLASRVLSPPLIRDAVDLLTNCCTSKETDLWHSLGNAWIIPSDQWKDYMPSYHPVFYNGWAPEYPFPETRLHDAQRLQREEIRSPESSAQDQDYQRVFPHPEKDVRYVSDNGSDPDDAAQSELISEVAEQSRLHQPFNHHQSGVTRTDLHVPRGGNFTPSEFNFQDRDDVSTDSAEHADMHLDPQRQFERHQIQYLEDLRNRGAKIVQVVYPRTANNDKELTVIRGEFLEILDDSRKWWKARNIRGQVAHVPHTIITPYPGNAVDDVFNNPLYTTRSSASESYYGQSESLLREVPESSRQHSAPPPMPADWVRRERQGRKGSASSSEDKDQSRDQEVSEEYAFTVIDKMQQYLDSQSIPPQPDHPAPPIPKENSSLYTNVQSSSQKSGQALNSHITNLPSPPMQPPPPPPPPPLPSPTPFGSKSINSTLKSLNIQQNFESTSASYEQLPSTKFSSSFLQKISSSTIGKGKNGSGFASWPKRHISATQEDPVILSIRNQEQKKLPQLFAAQASDQDLSSVQSLSDVKLKSELVTQNQKSKEASDKKSDTATIRMLHEEIRERLPLSKPKSIKKRLSCDEHPDHKCHIIHPHSTSEDITHWLKLKEFSERTKNILSNMSADEIFHMTKPICEKYLGIEEGGRLFSQLLLQKQFCSYRTMTAKELSSILHGRRQKLEEEHKPSAF